MHTQRKSVLARSGKCIVSSDVSLVSMKVVSVIGTSMAEISYKQLVRELCDKCSKNIRTVYNITSPVLAMLCFGTNRESRYLSNNSLEEATLKVSPSRQPVPYAPVTLSVQMIDPTVSMNPPRRIGRSYTQGFKRERVRTAAAIPWILPGDPTLRRFHDPRFPSEGMPARPAHLELETANPGAAGEG